MKGWKTWAGTAGWVMCEGAKAAWPEQTAALALAQTMFAGLGVIGIGHKLDRASLARRVTD